MSRMRSPDFLKKGARIAIVAPSGRINRETVDQAINTFENWGLEVVPGPHLYKDHFQFSGTDRERLSDLQEAMDDPEIKAIFCARGGYGMVRIIDRLNFAGFRKNPKWIIGFSDITVLHAHIHTCYAMETIHGSMAAGFAAEGPSAASVRSILFGEELHYILANHRLSRQGKARGRLIGGNLSILAGLSGSVSDLQTNEKILFIEEVGEHLYRIDRMMWSLKRAGKLIRLKGLIVGGMTDIPDTPAAFGKDADQIILDHVKDYEYPVCFGFPAGHQPDNRALILGRRISFEVQEQTSVRF